MRYAVLMVIVMAVMMRMMVILMQVIPLIMKHSLMAQATNSVNVGVSIF